MPAWQTQNDLPLRKHVIQRVRRFFEDNNSCRAAQPDFPDVVKKVELLLYSQARSQAEYSDKDTLATRLKRLGSEVEMVQSDSSDVAANSGDSYQLPPLLSAPCVGSVEYLFDEERNFQQDMDLHLRPDLGLPGCEDGCLDFESGDMLGCAPAFQFQEKAHASSLDGKLLDAPAFGGAEFGDNWFTFPEDDLISSEDSACAINGYGGGPHAVSETANNSYPTPWISSLQEEMPVPCGSDSLGFVDHAPVACGSDSLGFVDHAPVACGSDSLGFVDHAPVPDMFSTLDFNQIRHPQSLPYEGVPVPASFEGYGAFPGSDLDSCSRPISCLSPSIYPMPEIPQEEMKKARISKSKVRSKMHTPKFIKPRPLSRRWGLSAELQEDTGGNSGRVPFSSMLRKEDIDPLVHAYTCTKSNCGIMCTQLKKLLNHVKKCSLRKTPMKCSSCQWMGLLLSMHAQKCHIKCCPLPCCSHR